MMEKLTKYLSENQKHIKVQARLNLFHRLAESPWKNSRSDELHQQAEIFCESLSLLFISTIQLDNLTHV